MSAPSQDTVGAGLPQEASPLPVPSIATPESARLPAVPLAGVGATRGIRAASLGEISASLESERWIQRQRVIQVESRDAEGYFPGVSGRVVAEGGVVAFGNRAASSGAKDEVGAVYLYQSSDRPMRLRAQLGPGPAAQAYTGFGASLDLDGDLLIVGAPGELCSGRAPTAAPRQCGGARIFRSVAGQWHEEARLALPDGEQWGSAVAVSGTSALVSNGSQVQAFERTTEGWQRQGALQADGVGPRDGFGIALAMDGGLAIVGSGLADPAQGGERRGTLHTFARLGGRWVEQARYRPGDGMASDGFGAALALDGDTALLGASSAACPDGSYGCGAAYVLQRAGGNWVLQARLSPNLGEESVEAVGHAVALDGDRALVSNMGAEPGCDDSPLTGAVTLFRRVGVLWLQQGTLQRRERSPRARIGPSVAMAGGSAFLANESARCVPARSATDGEAAAEYVDCSSQDCNTRTELGFVFESDTVAR